MSTATPRPSGSSFSSGRVYGGTNQQWYLRPNGDGYFTIVSHDSGLVADDYNWDATDGAKVVQYTVGGGANQQWQLIPV